jgi:hypothetical protein
MHLTHINRLITETDEGPCYTQFTSCMKKNVDVGYLKPVTNDDGSIYVPGDFFSRICG